MRRNAMGVLVCLATASHARKVIKASVPVEIRNNERIVAIKSNAGLRRSSIEAKVQQCGSVGIFTALLLSQLPAAPCIHKVYCPLLKYRRVKSVIAVLDEELMLQADEAASFLATSTTALGYVATLLSLGIYTPQAVRLWSKKTGEGLAETTWILKLFAVTSTALYSLHLGLPVTSWADVASLTLQALVVNAFLFAFGSEQQRGKLLPASATYFFWMIAFFTDGIPEIAFSALQSFAAASLTFALAPQILFNFREGEAGNFSPITAALGLLLTSIRVITTLASGGDPILLATWAGAAIANAILTAQIIYFGTQKGVAVKDIFLSDFAS